MTTTFSLKEILPRFNDIDLVAAAAAVIAAIVAVAAAVAAVATVAAVAITAAFVADANYGNAVGKTFIREVAMVTEAVSLTMFCAKFLQS